MRRTSTCHLCGFAARLGDIVSVRELPIHDAEIERLERLGLERFSFCREDSLVPLMQASAAETLERAAINAVDIDRLVLTTSDYLQQKNRDDLAQVATFLGLTRALPLGVAQGLCTNFSLAFEVVESLLSSGKAQTVLLITADRYSSVAQRILRGNAGVGSDGVASCIMTRKKSGYALRSVAHAFNSNAMNFKTPDRLVAYVSAYAEGYSSACREALQRAGYTPDQCARLVVPNFSQTVLRNLAELSLVPRARMFTENLGRFAHCNSADQFIALGQLEDELRAEDVVLVTGAGEYIWGAAVLQRVEG